MLSRICMQPLSSKLWKETVLLLAEKHLTHLLSLVLNGVRVSLQLCMVLCLIILHHFYSIQSYLM